MKFPVKMSAWKYVLLACIFIGTFSQYMYRAPKRNFSDFHVPYTVGKKLLAGEQIYSFEKGLSYYKYTPFYANLMVPLSIFPEKGAAAIWFVLNFFFLMVLFSCARKIIAGDDPFDPFWLYAITVLFMSRFLIQNLHEGQANVFMNTLLILGLYYFVQKKRLTSAFFIGFSIMTKYMPVLFLPYFLLIGQIGLLAGIGAVILVLNFIPAIAFGMQRLIQLNFDQFHFLFASSLDPWSIFCHPNQSLLAWIARTFWEESIYPIQLLQLDRSAIFGIFFVAAGILYCLAVIPGIKKGRVLNTEASRKALCVDWSLLFICMALLNPNAWMNFFICLIFPYMTVLYHLMKKRGRDWSILGLTIFSFICNAWTSEEIVVWFAGDGFEIRSVVTIGTLALFAVLLILKKREIQQNALERRF